MTDTGQYSSNILSIDGGSSGLLALYVLAGMFARLQWDEKSETELKPCDYFDVIGGTGTGALVALMIGRLEMTVTQAIEAYVKLEQVLGLPLARSIQERQRNSFAFKHAFSRVLIEAGYGVDAPMLDEHCSKTMVFTLNKLDHLLPNILRSYRTRTSLGSTTILQAACAAIADTRIFDFVTIGDGHRAVQVFDATTGYCNPAMEILREAQSILGGNPRVSALVSLGTETKMLQLPSSGQKRDRERILHRSIIRDCERAHEEVHARLQGGSIYHRYRLPDSFNIEPGDLYAKVAAYLQQGIVSAEVDATIERMQDRVHGWLLKDINSIEPPTIKPKPRPTLTREFVGREDILNSMRRIHFPHQSARSNGPEITVLTGLGGSGKTQIALKFSAEYQTRYPDSTVYFIDASNEGSLKTELETLLRSQGAKFGSATFQDTLNWLTSSTQPWLMILDSADDPSLKLASYLPKCSKAHIIITTRDATRRTLSPESNHVVDGLETHDAVTLLLKSASYPRNTRNSEYAEEIVKEMGHLPLALSHAAAYILTHRCLSTYASTYLQSKIRILRLSPDLMQDYPHSVATTIQISLDRLPATALHLMQIFACLDARSIPYTIIIKAAERNFSHVIHTNPSVLQPGTVGRAAALMKIFCPSGGWMNVDFDDLISSCLRYSLIGVSTQNEEPFYSMHVLVQTYLQQTSNALQGYTFSQLASRLVASAIATNKNSNTYNRRLLPHMRLLRIQDITEAGDHYGIGRLLYEMGDKSLAVSHFKRCAKQWMRTRGENNRYTLIAMRDLAHSYAAIGRDRDALEVRKQLVEKLRKLCGDRHPTTMAAIDDLTASYLAVGEYQTALELCEAMLEEGSDMSEEYQLAMVTKMGSVASSYARAGRWEEASKLDEIVLKRLQEQLGENHLDTLGAMHNLANSYRALGNASKALELQRHVLDHFVIVLGKLHQDTLMVMRNVLRTYVQLRRLEEMEELLNTALLSHEEALGPQHELTIALRNFGATVERRLPRRPVIVATEETNIRERNIWSILGIRTMSASSTVVSSVATTGTAVSKTTPSNYKHAKVVASHTKSASHTSWWAKVLYRLRRREERTLAPSSL